MSLIGKSESLSCLHENFNKVFESSFLFFILSVNENSIEKLQKGCTKVHTIYTIAAKNHQKRKRKQKTTLSLELMPTNQ